MSFNGAGVYNPVVAPDFPAVAGTTIRAAQYNNQISDIATALTNCVTRDGQSPLTANMPMGGKKLTGMGNGSAQTDSVNLGQVQNNTMSWMGTDVGAVNALTFGVTPAITGYMTGQIFEGMIGTTNTGAATINIGGAGVKPLKKRALSGLVDLNANDLIIGTIHQFMYDGTNIQVLTISPLSALYPIGSIYFNATDNTNPAILLGFGTWISYATGRVLVGIDNTNPLMNTAGAAFGQSDSILPSHTHTFIGDALPPHSHTYTGVQGPPFNSGGNANFGQVGLTTSANSAGTPTGTISASGNSPVNGNYQPSIAIYIWKRTA